MLIFAFSPSIPSAAFSGPLVLLFRLGLHNDAGLTLEEAPGRDLILVRKGFVPQLARRAATRVGARRGCRDAPGGRRTSNGRAASIPAAAGSNVARRRLSQHPRLEETWTWRQ